MTQTVSESRRHGSLQRTLTLGPLILYGMGVIVGAGIYVAVGAVMQRPEPPRRFLSFWLEHRLRSPACAMPTGCPLSGGGWRGGFR